MLVRRTAFAATHGFDESFYFYAEESDLCMRLNKQGWGVVFNPTVNVVHVAGGHSVRVDRSDRFVREMVNSQSKLARKHLPPKQAQFYLECQWLFFKVAGFAWRVAGTILCNRLTAGVSAKVELFRMYSDVFREYMSDGSVRVRRTGGVL
jgi:GT2 family glycosyltransferase